MLLQKLITKIQHLFTSKSATETHVTAVTAKESLEENLSRAHPSTDALRPELAVSRKLLKHLLENVSESEFQWLCQHLNVEYSELSGRTYSKKVQELVLYYMRRDLLPPFVHTCQQLLPHLAWETAFPLDDEIKGRIHTHDDLSLRQQQRPFFNQIDRRLKDLLADRTSYNFLHELALLLDIDLDSFPEETPGDARNSYLDHLVKLGHLSPATKKAEAKKYNLLDYLVEQQRLTELLAKIKIFSLLIEHFTEDDVAEICFDSGFNFEARGPDPQLYDSDHAAILTIAEVALYIEGQKRFLVREAQERLLKFVAACHELRPDVDWAAAVGINPDWEAVPTPLQLHGYYPASIRKLMRHAFVSDETLMDFCRSHFPTALLSLSSEMSFQEKIQALLGFLLRHCALGELLTIMAAAYPEHFARFAPYTADPPQP